jgi:hypothetical protein
MPFTYTKNQDGLFTCAHCKFVAKNQSTMHYHLKKHDGVLPHPCSHCDQRFLQKGVLDLHIKIHHPETLEERNMFVCSFPGCEYEDAQKGNTHIHFLRVHMKDISDGIKRKSTDQAFKHCCTKCSQGFKSPTQFYYKTHACIIPSENHPNYQFWAKLTA